MRDFDPMDPNPNGMMNREPIYGDSDSGMTMFGILAALALALGVGAYFYSASDNNQQVASNNTPAVTAPATPSTPATPDSTKTDKQ